MFGFTGLEVRTYGILAACTGIQLLINQIEQPYARSLIVCDTPVNTTLGAEPSGSDHCGDRLHVIGEGAQLSGSGDSLENVGRFLITLFVSGFADSHGRKAAALVGWSFINLSVLCFFLASFIQPWAKTLFIIAQGFQGMSGIGLIAEIVARDIAAAFPGDPTPLFTRRAVLGTVMGFFFFGMVVVIQYSEITEFKPVWSALLMANVALLSGMVSLFPETQNENDRQSHIGLSLTGLVHKELGAYRTIFRENRFVKYSILEAFFKNISGGFHIIMLPWMMATFGYNQLELMFMLAPSMVVGFLCMPLIPSFCKKYSHRAVLMAVFWGDFALEWIGMPLLTSSVGFMPFPILIAYIRAPLGGMGSVSEAIGTRLIGTAEGAKLSAIMQLNGFMTGSIASLLFTRVFDAEAKTLLPKVAPFMLASSVKIISCLIFLFGHREMVLAAADQLTEEARKEEDSKPTEAKKED